MAGFAGFRSDIEGRVCRALIGPILVLRRSLRLALLRVTGSDQHKTKRPSRPQRDK